ncbi:uncharacterized protein LOC130766146 [Actinidia eriantha]|uniref:uncharacterized protein LOC130766146 n=1 Tax=Actinidia eriantha TaxID=165200 RepID=UPI00258B648B|nr:uncharacterized protein LOC130766146 [Actinidia eriantha]
MQTPFLPSPGKATSMGEGSTRKYTKKREYNEPTIAESEDARIVGEFAQLLDACEASPNVGGDNTADVEYQMSLMPTISERFLGMRSAIVTNNSRLKSFGGKLGFTILQMSDLIDNGHAVAESARDVMASELLKWLGFQNGKTAETCPFDLVFIHVGDGGLMHIADPGSEIGSRLHVSLVVSYVSVLEDDDPILSNQLYILILTIPADRFIHEIAFKLWKAPEYGA